MITSSHIWNRKRKLSDNLERDRDGTFERLQRARSGDLAAVEEIYRAYRAQVYTLALRLCRRPEDADEVVQDTFLEIVRNLSSYRSEGSFSAWVRRIAANKALMRLRRESVRRAIPLDGDSATQGRDSASRPIPIDDSMPMRPVTSRVPAPVSERIDLESALRQLDDISRCVLWLYDIEGYTHREIGEMLGKTSSFSKSRLARAHSRLRELLEPLS